MKQQIKAFKSQLRIANKLKIPIVIHCRDNDTEVFELIQEVTNFNRISIFLLFFFKMKNISIWITNIPFMFIVSQVVGI
jgi:Tat protein secretion system quality control protein TatD with DNase activity